MDFFYRIDHISMTAGPKSAGFFASICTKALAQLRATSMSQEEFQMINMKAKARIIEAKILPKKQVSDCWIIPHENSWVPQAFSTHRVFGASIGGTAEDLSLLSDENVEDHVGPAVRYTPHNCDTPAQTLALMVLFQTWAEFAHGKLRCMA